MLLSMDISVTDTITDYFSNLDTYWDYFAVFGVCCASLLTLKYLFQCISCFNTYVLARLLHQTDFTVTYGGSWAVVTGASEGIGRSYALKLAERNMNVFLISRNIDKLEKVAKEIKSKFNVVTICYPMDLSDIANSDKYDDLKNELSGLDIGVLVNNVGTMFDRLQYFLTVPKERLLKVIDLNMTVCVLMTYMLLPNMVSKKKGAIINVSSGASVHPTPLMSSYSASKAFVDSFTEALQYEYAQYGVVIQTVRPFYVSTNMTYQGKPNILLVDPDIYVQNALYTLGRSPKTYGYWPHGIFGLIGEYMPLWVYRFSAVYVNPILWSWLTGVAVDIKKKI